MPRPSGRGFFLPECHAVKRQFLANPEHHLAIDVSVVARMTGVLVFEMKFFDLD